jgi:3-methyladenine DNA glycosylase AlkD
MNKKSSQEILETLKKQRDEQNLAGMSRFGISTKHALGISVTKLRGIAKAIGGDDDDALRLLDCKIHEARILATMIAEPEKVTKKLMRDWAMDFNSWNLCGQSCNNLFRKTEFAIEHSFKWPESDKLFIKRAGFVLIAVLALHSKEMTDEITINIII